MFKKLIIILLLVVAALAGYAAMKPSEYTISREISIQASPSQIFPLINNAQETGRWMPWVDMDPAMKMTYEGPEAGVGSRAVWNSTGKMGVGSSTVSESIENKSVKYDLAYEKPFPMKQVAEISIQEANGQSVVTWSVSGHSPFIGRFMCIFMNMDKMVGSSFESGLAKLKGLAEKTI